MKHTLHILTKRRFNFELDLNVFEIDIHAPELTLQAVKDFHQKQASGVTLLTDDYVGFFNDLKSLRPRVAVNPSKKQLVNCINANLQKIDLDDEDRFFEVILIKDDIVNKESISLLQKATINFVLYDDFDFNIKLKKIVDQFSKYQKYFSDFNPLMF